MNDRYNNFYLIYLDEIVEIVTGAEHIPLEAKDGITYVAIGMGTVVAIIVVVIVLDGLTVTRTFPCRKYISSSFETFCWFI